MNETETTRPPCEPTGFTAKHGTAAGYQQGCRCCRCGQARAEKVREYRERKAAKA